MPSASDQIVDLGEPLDPEDMSLMPSDGPNQFIGAELDPEAESVQTAGPVEDLGDPIDVDEWLKSGGDLTPRNVGDPNIRAPEEDD